MLLHVEKRTERDDWEGFPDLMKRFNEALATAGDWMGDDERAHERGNWLLRRAFKAVVDCEDLTAADRWRVGEIMKRNYNSALAAGLAASRPDGPASLSEFMEGAISVDTAVARGEPTVDELLVG